MSGGDPGVAQVGGQQRQQALPILPLAVPGGQTVDCERVARIVQARLISRSVPADHAGRLPQSSEGVADGSGRQRRAVAVRVRQCGVLQRPIAGGGRALVQEGAGVSVPGVAGADCAVDGGEREVGQNTSAASASAPQVVRLSETVPDRDLGPAPFPPHVILELRECDGVRRGRGRRNRQAARETQPAGGPRDEIAAGIAGIPAPTGGMLVDPAVSGGCDLRRVNLSFLTKFQVVDRLGLEGSDASERGWPGTLLGAVAEVGDEGTSQRSGKVSLNRVGSLKELVEFEHGRTSVRKGK